MTFQKQWIASLLVAALVGFVGCQKGYSPDAGVIVKGKIVKEKQPLVVTGRDNGTGRVEVKLVPVQQGPGTDSATGNAKEDGSFEIVYAGKGVKPGKYKVAVQQISANVDQLNGQFSDQTTTIVVDVPADKVGKTLDLGEIDLASPPPPAQ